MLSISEGTTLILSYHKELDNARENKLNGIKIGTTGRGIGPAYEDRIGRRAIRLCDIFDKDNLHDKVKNALFHHNPIRIGLGISEIKTENIISEIEEISSFVKPFVKNVWKELLELQETKKKHII